MALEKMFGGSIALVLDKAWREFWGLVTISEVAEDTGLSYKTAQKALEKLVKLGFAREDRKIGNARTFRFAGMTRMHEGFLHAVEELKKYFEFVEKEAKEGERKRKSLPEALFLPDGDLEEEEEEQWT